jgi:hypothetical protein
MVNEASAPYPRDRLITADEFGRHPEWGYCELKRGRVVPITTTQLTTEVGRVK